MRETRSSGSVEGVVSNDHSYSDFTFLPAIVRCCMSLQLQQRHQESQCMASLGLLRTQEHH
jgi:hypothetical protein